MLLVVVELEVWVTITDCVSVIVSQFWHLKLQLLQQLQYDSVEKSLHISSYFDSKKPNRVIFSFLSVQSLYRIIFRGMIF